MASIRPDEAARRRARAVAQKLLPRGGEGLCDEDFWDLYTPSERVMLVWPITVEEHLAQGRDREALKFQRSVGGLQRRKR